MAENKMQLYVWEEFAPDYNDGLAFAIAENFEDAQILAMEGHTFNLNKDDWGRVKVYPLDKPFGRLVAGGS